jgi:hypothetical protein
MASWLDVLASPNNMTNGRLNPAALLRGFTQQGRAEIDQQNQLAINAPAAQNQAALAQAFKLGQEMATLKQLDGGQLGSFGADVARTDLQGRQLSNQGAQQGIVQNESLFNQGQQDARARAIQGRPLTTQGVSADIAYRQDARADRNELTQMEQFNVNNEQQNRQLDLTEAAQRDANQYRDKTLDINQKELDLRKVSELLRHYTEVGPTRGLAGVTPAQEQYGAALQQQLEQSGVQFPKLPTDPRVGVAQRVHQQMTQPQSAPVRQAPAAAPQQSQAQPPKNVWGSLNQAIAQHPQLIDLQGQLDQMLKGKLGQVSQDEVDRLRTQIAQLMKGVQ